MTHPGFYLSLSREAAKQLFGQREDAAVREFVEQFVQSEQNREDGLILECGADWALIDQALTGGAPDPEAGTMPLHHVVLGGRHLYRGDDLFAVLVRPDLTAHVAEAIAGLDESDFRARCREVQSNANEEALAGVAKTLQHIGEFFRRAAEAGNAVIFAAPRG